jgi:hypothetical protein
MPFPSCIPITSRKNFPNFRSPGVEPKRQAGAAYPIIRAIQKKTIVTFLTGEFSKANVIIPEGGEDYD